MMNERLIRYTAAWMAVFTIIAMTLIIVFVSNKNELLLNSLTENNVQSKPFESMDAQGDNADTGRQNDITTKDYFEVGFEPMELTFLTSEEKTDCLLLEGTSEESKNFFDTYQILVNLPQKELIVSYQPSQTLVTLQPELSEDSLVSNISYRFYKGEQQWKITFSDYVEADFSVEKNRLFFDVLSIRDSYDTIVVIDPAGGGEDYGFASELSGETLYEKNITLALAKDILKELENSDKSIGCFLVRDDDFMVDMNDCVAFANEINADLYLRLETSYDISPEKSGAMAIYSEKYVIPFFGGVNFADVILRNYAIQMGTEALGLYSEEDQVFLENFTMPSTILKFAYFSNSNEIALFTQNDYRREAALGIVAGLQQSITEQSQKRQNLINTNGK